MLRFHHERVERLQATNNGIFLLNDDIKIMILLFYKGQNDYFLYFLYFCVPLSLLYLHACI